MGRNQRACPRCPGGVRRGSCSHPSHDGHRNRRFTGRGNNDGDLCPSCKGTRRQGCCQRSIKHHWKVMPTRAKDFILSQGHLSDDGWISVQKLVDFWSRAENVDMTQRIDICGASWYLALIYLRLGLLKEARALTINGAFIHQCIIDSIDHIKNLCSSNASKEEIMLEMPCCTEGFYATESPESMEFFIQRYLPPDYQQTMTTFANLSNKNDVMGYVNQIGDDYNSTKKRPSRVNTDVGAELTLVFVDDGAVEAGDKRHECVILSSLSLKAALSSYAEKRGISLRSLRFTLDNKTLFLSQVGKKSLIELQMQDEDIIYVQNIMQPQETKDSSSAKKNQVRPSKAKPKRHGSKAKKSRKQEVIVKVEKTEEELKIEHSKLLSKIHEELQPQLKLIRQRLNNLLIERSKPKSRSGHRRSKTASLPVSHAENPCANCVGGKVGKSHFVLVVGEVSNLYKSGKSSSLYYHSAGNMPTLDLHGYTKAEALAELDKSLKKWYDTALKGSYPFITKVKVISGCGNQILSETVEEWIKLNKTVSNAPKNSY